MADLPSNVRFSWQLISQFVSWEFCRYMSENNEANNSETDVLAFLRKMIVQRTEKSVSDVTKQEILAKFIMEVKAISNFQVSSIIPLSESVKRICPELSSAVSKLVHHLETFYEVLETTDESRKELIHIRIEDAISDFSKEASRLLPEPDLLQVVDSWNEIHHHVHPHPKPLKKSIYNPELFEKVLECLYFEGITPSEARLIAVALNEDKVFENILRNADAEPETEADSEAFTFSQSSQPVYSQEFMKNTHAPKPCVHSLNQESPHFQAHSQVRPPVHSPLQMSDDSPADPGGIDIIQNEDPPDFLGGTPPSPPPSPDYPFIHGKFAIQDRNSPLQKSSISHRQFAQSSADESGGSEGDLHNRIQAKFQQIHETQKKQNAADSDTSDCDKSPQFKFLTPTYFKEGKKKVIQVSDVESNDSSILTSIPGSQQCDPNWSSRNSFLPATEYVRANKKKNIRYPTKKKKVFQRNRPVRKKKPVQQISSNDSNENHDNRILRQPSHHPSAPVTPIDICELSAEYRSSLENMRPNKRKRLKNSPVKKKKFSQRSLPTRRRKPTQTIYSSDSGEDSIEAAVRRAVHQTPTPDTPIDDLSAEYRSLHQPSTSATRTKAELRGPLKKGLMKKALYRSPTLCIDDFVSVLRKQNSESLSEVSVPGVKRVKKTTTSSSSNSVKKQKCKQCNKTYKTTIALRRHILLKHSDPPEDSDCDA